MDDKRVTYTGALIFLLIGGLFFYEYLEEEEKVAKYGSRFTMSLEKGELAWEQASIFLKQEGPYVVTLSKRSKFSDRSVKMKGSVNGCTYTVSRRIKKDQTEFTVVRSGECSEKALSNLMQGF